MFDLSFLLDDGYLKLLRDGVLTTLRLFVVSGLMAIVVGIVLTTLRALPVIEHNMRCFLAGDSRGMMNLVTH